MSEHVPNNQANRQDFQLPITSKVNIVVLKVEHSPKLMLFTRKSDIQFPCIIVPPCILIKTNRCFDAFFFCVSRFESYALRVKFIQSPFFFSERTFQVNSERFGPSCYTEIN